MKDYFEYPLNKEIIQQIEKYYENTELQQHDRADIAKTRIKLDRIMELTTINRDSIVLDVGCSNGNLLKLLSNRIKKGVGIDISKNMIESNNALQTFPKNISFKHFDGRKYSTKTKFDIIFLIDSLEHALEPDLLISNLKSNLKKDGRMIIEVPFTGWLSELVGGKYHAGHLRYYDPIYLRKKMESLGFNVKRIRTYNSVPFSSFFAKNKLLWGALDFIINKIPSKIYPYYGEIIIELELDSK